MRDRTERLNVLARIGAARGARKTTAAPPRSSTPAHTATIAATLARRPAMPLLPGEPGNTGKTWKANNRPLCPARRASAEMCAKVPLHGTFAHISAEARLAGQRDRKSTRLNSSHVRISYAVFFFNDPAPPQLYPLSLHHPLPTSLARRPAMPLLPGEPANTGKTWKANNRPLSRARRPPAEMCAKGPLHGTFAHIPAEARLAGQ